MKDKLLSLSAALVAVLTFLALSSAASAAEAPKGADTPQVENEEPELIIPTVKTPDQITPEKPTDPKESEETEESEPVEEIEPEPEEPSSPPPPAPDENPDSSTAETTPTPEQDTTTPHPLPSPEPPAPEKEVPSDDSISRALPTPQMLGEDWVWPWNAPDNQANISAETWKEEFWAPLDPRPEITKAWINLERISDATYQKESEQFTPTTPVHGGDPGPLSRRQLLKELSSQTAGIKDFAFGSYQRTSQPPSTAADTLTLKLTSFSEDYVSERAAAFEITKKHLAQVFNESQKRTANLYQSRDKQTGALLKEYEQALLDVYTFRRSLTEMRETGIPAEALTKAEQSLAAKETRANEVGDRLDLVIGHNGETHGAELDGANGGFVVWTTETSPKASSIQVTGKLRLDNVILDFDRTIIGPFDEEATLNDTADLLTLISSRISSYLNTPDAAGTPVVVRAQDPLHVAFESSFTKPTTTEIASVENERGQLPSFIETPSPSPQEAASPEKVEAPVKPENPVATIRPPEPAHLPPAEVRKLKAEGAKAYAANDLGEALHIYRKLATTEPDDVEVQIALGRTLNYLNDYNGAIEVYSKVFDLAPDTPNVRTWLAELYLARGDRSRAVQWIGEELEANPRSGWAHSWLGSAHLEIGDPSSAKSSFQRASGLDANVGAYRFQNGSALQSREYHRRALTEFAAASYLAPSDPAPYLGVATSYDALKEHSAAIQWYERYLELVPTGPKANVARKALLKLRQKTQ